MQNKIFISQHMAKSIVSICINANDLQRLYNSGNTLSATRLFQGTETIIKEVDRLLASSSANTFKENLNELQQLISLNLLLYQKLYLHFDNKESITNKLIELDNSVKTLKKQINRKQK